MTLDHGLFRGPDGVARCAWCAATPDYVRYHDEEWGFPVHDDRRLFEKLSLEGFQSGLSWLTILRKREGFRAAFANFEAARVARFTPKQVERLLRDAGIIRHRGKIEATINNAGRVADLVDEFGSLSNYVWQYAPAPATRPRRMTLAVLRRLGQSAESAAMSKDLKHRGWKFVGPTTAYAFMQAMGLVNDHLEGCAVRGAVEKQRKEGRGSGER
jgi:DNA-3-methyladenine glycosylase I